ncbi:hypothetical protein [Natrinema sp. 74]|uniref:hypothetical protein n=1 Tax=Natrinema sp. 74 TaxID=3384159 RepID=UPI0038D44838
MKRRKLLSAISLLGVSGCIGNNGSNDSKEKNKSNSGKSGSNRKVTAVGSDIVEVTVHQEFNKSIIFKTDCRNKGFTIDSGETYALTRKEDDRSCPIRLLIDGEESYSANISTTSTHYLTVTKDGKVESSVAIA